MLKTTPQSALTQTFAPGKSSVLQALRQKSRSALIRRHPRKKFFKPNGNGHSDDHLNQSVTAEPSPSVQVSPPQTKPLSLSEWRKAHSQPLSEKELQEAIVMAEATRLTANGGVSHRGKFGGKSRRR